MRRFAVVLALTLVALGGSATVAEAGGGGGCEGKHRAEVTATRVDIQQYCFTQTVVHVAPGANVTWTNYDETPHSVTAPGGEWGDYEDIAPRTTVTHEFDAPGVYPYFCYLHPGMVGAVVVDGGDTATQLAAATNPIAPAHDGGATLAWIVGGAVAGLAAVVVTSVVVTRRRT